MKPHQAWLWFWNGVMAARPNMTAEQVKKIYKARFQKLWDKFYAPIHGEFKG